MSITTSIFTRAEGAETLVSPEKPKIKIASFIGVTIGGDIGQYQETLSYSRNETRKLYLDEIINAALKLSNDQYNPADALWPLQQIQEIADGKREYNKFRDSLNIALSIGEFFKSEIEKLHQVNGITSSERKIEFINNLNNDKAQYDHFVVIHFAPTGRGLFKMTGVLGAINNSGIERSFEGNGQLVDCISQVAAGIFYSVMNNEFPNWVNPNPNLTWIAGPKNANQLSFKEAKLYCLGQSARLPLASEFLLAQQGGAFRNGGVERILNGEIYFVGDLMRQAGVNYYVTTKATAFGIQTDVQAVVGQTGYVWCVKGTMNQTDTYIQKIYSLRRILDPKGMNILYFPESVEAKNLLSLKAIESLLINSNAFGAELDETLSTLDLMTNEEALKILKANNNWPLK